MRCTCPGETGSGGRGLLGGAGRLTSSWTVSEEEEKKSEEPERCFIKQKHAATSSFVFTAFIDLK